MVGPRLEPRGRFAETRVDSSRLLDDERADSLMLSDDVDVSEAALERACQVDRAADCNAAFAAATRWSQRCEIVSDSPAASVE